MSFSRRAFLASTFAAPMALKLSRAFGSPDPEASTDGRSPAMSFKDGKFRILQLTDLHLGYNCPEGLERAAKTIEYTRTLLDVSKPDLAILTGDIVWLEATALAGGYEEAWARIVKPFEDANVPYVMTLGNHDHELKIPAKAHYAAFSKSPLNMTRDVPYLPGAGNCYIPIVGADGKECRRLWIFDSHSYCRISDNPRIHALSEVVDWEYDWIKPSQIQWYIKESQRAEEENGGVPIPSLAFFHIPTPEYWELYEKQQDGSWKPVEGVIGRRGEDPCSPRVNSGLVGAAIERGDLEGIFVGHEHINDYIGIYKGIALAYGRKTGEECYGDLPHGGRIIDLTEGKPGFATRIVMLDGSTESEYTYKQ